MTLENSVCLLRRAMEICWEAHAGALDKAGQPYALHPQRLMARISEIGGVGWEESAVALLHDVVEDSHWTLEDLAREGFPPRVVAAVETLTRRDGEPYEAYIERVLTDPMAVQVKLLDLADNLDLRRLPALTDADWPRIQRYHRAYLRIRQALQQATEGSPAEKPSPETSRALCGR